MFELKEHYCPICGKEFYPSAYWVYKDWNKIYCSWSCLRKSKKTKQKIKRTGHNCRKVEQCDLDGTVLKTFDSIQDAADSVEGYPDGIVKACRLSKTYHNYKWRYKK